MQYEVLDCVLCQEEAGLRLAIPGKIANGAEQTLIHLISINDGP